MPNLMMFYKQLKRAKMDTKNLFAKILCIFFLHPFVNNFIEALFFSKVSKKTSLYFSEIFSKLAGRITG
jgi:hypothetical protein